MKQISAVLFILMLLLSACGAKEKETPAASTVGQETAQPAQAAQQKKTTSPTFSEQDVLFPSEGHPALVERDGGSEWMTAFGEARSDAVFQDYMTLQAYLESHQKSPLAVHFAGVRTGDINIDWALVILLDEPENKALLDEIAAIGLRTDYRIEKGTGTKAYLDACLPEIRDKLNALRDKVKAGTASDEEKELIQHYKIGQPAVSYDMGRICINVVIKTPWYSIGENWGEADMYRDLEHCKDLFRKLIGDYDDIMTFGFPV